MNRYDIVYLFDAQDANPNGDPDAGNLPRLDVETSQGLVTDVCLKRKIRNFIQTTQKDKKGCEIFLQEKRPLNPLLVQACTETGVPSAKNSDRPNEEVRKAQKYLCEKYYDIRAFGGVLSTGPNCGQIRGPVQLSFARSIDPVIASEHTITRVAAVDKEESTMGRKFTIPYGLYRAHGFINPYLAEQTGFSEEDVKLFFLSLQNAFQFDASAARPPGSINPRALIVFEHDSQLGNTPSHDLFDRVTVKRNNPTLSARSFKDYTLTIDEKNLPKGVSIKKIV